MLSLHNVKRIRAKGPENPEHNSNWVELHIEGGYSIEEHLTVNLYFSSPKLAREFYEAYPDKLTAAEQALVRDYHPTPEDLGSVSL